MKLTDLQGLAVLCRAVFPTSVIGGGAPRDAFLGRPIKDVDLAVECDRDNFRRLCDELASILNGSVQASMPGAASILDVPNLDIVMPGGHPPINVIFREGCVFDDMHDYDFGISQIAVTPRGVLYTPAFQRDVRERTITYTHAAGGKQPWHVASSTRRLQRLKAKYPDFVPVDCSAIETVLPE